MEGRLLLKNCSVLRSGGKVSRGQAVLVEGTQIARVEADAMIPALPGDWVVACEGRVVMPGLVDCHSNLLAALHGRGSPTPNEVATISAHALALGLRNGVTTHADLLTTPHDVRGALEAQATVARQLGARLVQAHANVSPEQLDHNAAASGPKGLVSTLLGLGSSSRCDDRCLAHASALQTRLNSGVHLPLAENEDDLATTFSTFGKQVAARLDGFGLLSPRSIGAFARALDGPGTQLAAKRGMLLAPWVDANHAGSFEAMLSSGVALGPCTAGQRRVWDAATSAVGAATTVARAGRVHRTAEVPWQLLFDGPSRLLTALFEGSFGEIAVGHTADFVVLDAVEAGDALSWERLAQVPVGWVVVAGRVVAREGQLVGAEFLELARDAARAVESVWARA